MIRSAIRRAFLVGLTFLIESVIEISVSDPPYAFTDITTRSPAKRTIKRIVPKPANIESPTSLNAATGASSPFGPDASAPSPNTQTPESALAI